MTADRAAPRQRGASDDTPTTASYLLNGLVAKLLGVDAVRGAELLGQVELAGVDVNGEDALGLEGMHVGH